MPTLEDYLAKRLARAEERYGKDDAFTRNLREQLASIRDTGGRSTYEQFTYRSAPPATQPKPKKRTRK